MELHAVADRDAAIGPIKRTPLWLWPNLLSLDAPLVAALWQWLFARCLHVRWEIWPAIVLTAAVWLIYAADRVLDSRRTEYQTARHQFYRRHRRTAGRLWLVVLLCTAVMAVQLPRALFLRGSVLLIAVCIYLVLVQGLVHVSRFTWLKEAAVGALFAAGTTLVVWTGVSTFADAVGIVLFAGLCWINCVAIEVWESGRSVLPIPFAAGMLAICAGLLVLVNGTLTGEGIAAAELISAIAFLFLHYRAKRCSRNALRVLADVALFSPVLVLPFL